MKELEANLSKALDDPNRWEFDQYVTKDSITGVQLWLGNGFLSLHVWKPTEIRFPFFMRWRLWRKLVDMKARKITEALGGTDAAGEINAMFDAEGKFRIGYSVEGK